MAFSSPHQTQAITYSTLQLKIKAGKNIFSEKFLFGCNECF